MKKLKMIGLAQGDLTTVKASEAAQFLIISSLPGDYNPTPGSLIAALQSAYGVNVGNLAAAPAADYRATHNCWISTPLTGGSGQTIPYQRLICFESTGSAAPAQIHGVFDAIRQFVPAPPPIPNPGPSAATSMLSTGSAGADRGQVLTALFNGCRALMTGGTGYNLTSFRIVVFQAAQQQQMVSLFDSLKTSGRP